MTDQALLDAVNAVLMGALLVGFLGGLLGAAVASWLGSLSRWWLYRRGTGGRGMTAADFQLLVDLLGGGLAVVLFALGYLGGHLQ